MVNNFKKIKKGQMKIQQMAFLLVTVFIFFALIGLLILSIKFSGLKEKATEIAEDKSSFLVSKLANSPEFSCGNAYGPGRASCIDFDKLMIIKEKSEIYKKFWGISRIEIVKIYPSSNIVCDKQNYPECGRIIIIQGEGISTENYVALCRKEFDMNLFMNYDKCELAKILVSYEVRE